MAGAKGDRDVRPDPETTDEKETVPPAVPAPPYRHAAPSGPWPWMDFKHIDDITPASDGPVDESWRGYPQNKFGNWTRDQVERSGMLIKCSKNRSSTIYLMDVRKNGQFIRLNMGHGNNNDPCMVSPENQGLFWEKLHQERPGGIRVRSLCVHDLTIPTLQMLGTRYNIEPFFFTSSVNWIPSRYQEAPSHREGDHITVTLPFVRTLHSTSPSTSSTPLSLPTRKGSQHSSHSPLSDAEVKQIDTQAPFHLQDGNMLFVDLLAIHMVRDVKTSTIISYHPDSTWCRTSAERLHKLMMLVGESVYWQHIFKKTEDPTFLFLTILWYALYAWDEAFELLYKHVSTLESDVLKDSPVQPLHQPLINQEQHKDSPMKLTRQLHVLQAHLLHYQSLLRHFRISVEFIQNTPNPAMESEIFNGTHDISKELMERECKNLLSEIERLEMRRELLSNRLKNAMDLAYATVNINDSRLTRKLTEATVRDSAAMRQISYLTMIFLPASFIASVFGMNVSEINPGSLETLAHYVETTICLTLFTVYIVVTLQSHSTIHTPGATLPQRAAWPILFPKRWVQKKPDKSADDNV